MPSKWKVQLSAPSTCELTTLTFNWIDPIEGPKEETRDFGCIYYEVYDVLLPPEARVHTIAGVERVCSAHVLGTDAAIGKFLWQDGNWKDSARYIKYQQDWFLWLNVQQWLARKAAGIISQNEPLMPELLPFRTEPVTPGSVTAPTAQQAADLQRLYGWNIDQNNRLGTVTEIIETETGNRETKALLTWRFEALGDARLLFVDSNQGLSNPVISRIQADADVQFGLGKVVIEG